MENEQIAHDVEKGEKQTGNVVTLHGLDENAAEGTVHRDLKSRHLQVSRSADQIARAGMLISLSIHLSTFRWCVASIYETNGSCVNADNDFS